MSEFQAICGFEDWNGPRRPTRLWAGVDVIEHNEVCKAPNLPALELRRMLLCDPEQVNKGIIEFTSENPDFSEATPEGIADLARANYEARLNEAPDLNFSDRKEGE